jgi:hypothetical protein
VMSRPVLVERTSETAVVSMMVASERVLSVDESEKYDASVSVASEADVDTRLTVSLSTDLETGGTIGMLLKDC